MCLETAFSISSLGLLLRTELTIVKFIFFSSSAVAGGNFLFLEVAPGVIEAIPLASFSFGNLSWNLPTLAVDDFATVIAACI